jgi:hypothetical protein
MRVLADDLPFYETGRPEEKQKVDQTIEYFDKLKYLKATKLATMAGLTGNSELQSMYETQAQETMIGVDPYGPPGKVMRAIPDSEKNYFGAFSGEVNPMKRVEILRMTMPDMSRIYQAQWDRNDLSQAQQKGKITEDEYASAMSNLRETSGFDTSITDWARYKLSSSGKAKNFSNYARARVLEEYFEDKEMPPPDYLGFSPAVDLDDVKLKMINNEGEKMHDYNLWESRQRELWRKPYLDEAAQGVDISQSHRNRMMVRQQIKNMMGSYGANGVEVYVEEGMGKGNSIDYDLKEDRTAEMVNQLKKLGMVK